jgi:hypothetical protein
MLPIQLLLLNESFLIMSGAETYKTVHTKFCMPMGVAYLANMAKGISSNAKPSSMWIIHFK